tara:strand:- start:13787 stop:16042 length:2256 start_codon:yes stop_codon:yes gene_type:complete
MAEKTTKERLNELLKESVKDLENQKKTSQRLDYLDIQERQSPLLSELDFLDEEILDYEKTLERKQKEFEKIEQERIDLDERIKEATDWFDSQNLAPRGREAQRTLARQLNQESQRLFGSPIQDPSLIEASLDEPTVQRRILDGFRSRLSDLENDLVNKDEQRSDIADEVSAINKDISATKRDVNSANYELDQISEGNQNQIDSRLSDAPSAESSEEEIVRWLIGDPDEPNLSFTENLKKLSSGEDGITPGLKRLDKIVQDTEKIVYDEGRRTRERISDGERLPESFSPEARREPRTIEREVEDPAEAFSPEAVRRQAAQDRRDRATERSDRLANDPGQRAGRRRERDPNRSGQFGGGRADVFAEDTEPFSPEAMRSRRPVRSDASEETNVFDEGMGALDSFVRGEEEEEVEIVEEGGDDGTPSADESAGGGENGGVIEEDADADADVDLTSDATATFILENFGLTTFFLDRDDMLIEDPETGEPINVLKYIENTGKTNDEEVLGLISQTEWYQNTGPTARAFEREWSIAGEAGRIELLDATSDLISREAKKIGLTLEPEQLEALAFNAKMMGMDDYEIRQEFVDNWELSFDSEAVQSGSIAALRNKVNQTAGKYMLLLDDSALAGAAESLYLGETTLEGLEAGFRNQAIGQMPELGNLIKQGYTPEMYFSSYKQQAERLLERKIDFLGDDRNMFINIMGGQTDDTYIQKPLTLTQANRYFRGLDEWKYTRNANQEARGMADQIGRMFGAVA